MANAITLLTWAMAIAKPIPPEGVAGVVGSADGRNIAVSGPDGKWGNWPLDGGGLHSIPGLDSKYNVLGWTPDGDPSTRFPARPAWLAEPQRFIELMRQTGKMEFWKAFAANLPGKAGNPHLPNDTTAYVYGYTQAQSEAYVVKGLHSRSFQSIRIVRSHDP